MAINPSTMPQRLQGTLTQWNDDKGFGFAAADGSGAKTFVHIKAFQTRPRRPAVGDRISYLPERDAQGRWQATQALLMGEPTTPQSRAAAKQSRERIQHGALPVWGWPLALAAGALLLGVGLAAFKVLPSILGLWLILINVLTFLIYAKDKAAARQGTWRTEEIKLHALALLGGWPAALLAQRRLRHKSSKASFQGVFWLTVVGNVLLMGWLTGSGGHELLQSILTPLLRNL